jgi:hypothetical protein
MFPRKSDEADNLSSEHMRRKAGGIKQSRSLATSLGRTVTSSSTLEGPKLPFKKAFAHVLYELLHKRLDLPGFGRGSKHAAFRPR